MLRPSGNIVKIRLRQDRLMTDSLPSVTKESLLIVCNMFALLVRTQTGEANEMGRLQGVRYFSP